MRTMPNNTFKRNPRSTSHCCAFHWLALEAFLLAMMVSFFSPFFFFFFLVHLPRPTFSKLLLLSLARLLFLRL